MVEEGALRRAESCWVVAPGTGIGLKRPLALVECSTEKHLTLVTDLLVGVPERGLIVTRPM